MEPVNFVPPDFVVPLSLETPRFRLEPLGPQHNDADYAAWTSSIEHIRRTPGFPDGNWPDGRSTADNLRDLRRHADDFEHRRGFTYTVLDPGTADVIGCLYIYPDPAEPQRAQVQSWVRESRASSTSRCGVLSATGSRPSGPSRPWPTPSIGQKTVDSTREEDRVPVVRPLVGLAALAGAFSVGRAHPVDRARGGGRGPRRRRRLLPRPPLRPAARVALPAPRGDRRPHQAHRDRHGRHRHALREPALHGRGRRRRRPHRRSTAAARDQSRLARAGHRRVPLFGYVPSEGETDADMAREHAAVFLQALSGVGFATPNPTPMFSIPRACAPGASLARAARSDLVGRGITRDRRVGRDAGRQPDVVDAPDGGRRGPVPPLQAEQIRSFRAAWTAAGHTREPRVSVSRSIFALVDDRDRAYFGRANQATDQVGYLDAQTKAIFGRSYAAEPDVLVKELPATRRSRRPTRCC